MFRIFSGFLWDEEHSFNLHLFRTNFISQQEFTPVHPRIIVCVISKFVNKHSQKIEKNPKIHEISPNSREKNV